MLSFNLHHMRPSFLLTFPLKGDKYLFLLTVPLTDDLSLSLSLYQHDQGIRSLRVFAMAGGEVAEPVWELVGYSHDTNSMWDLGQVKIIATEVS